MQIYGLILLMVMDGSNVRPIEYGLTSSWNPSSIPTGYNDTSQIAAGPSQIQRHRLIIRNNNDENTVFPDILVKDIKIGTLSYLSDINNPPPPTGGGGGGGSGTGGVLDSRVLAGIWQQVNKDLSNSHVMRVPMIDGLVT